MTSIVENGGDRMPINLFTPSKQTDKPYQSLLDMAEQHRTQTHIELGEISSKIAREIIPGTFFEVKDEISNESISYEIVKQLGVGSFGVVYKGFDMRDPEKKEVAIKVEPYSTLEPCIEPLRKVVDSAGIIDGLVTVFAAGRIEKLLKSSTPGVHRRIFLSKRAISSLNRFLRIGAGKNEGEVYLGCLVMEYVNGRSLASVVEAARDQPSNQEDQIRAYRLRLLQIMIDTAIAISKLHKSGFVHCDLHPRNILVTNSDVKIIDFTCIKHIGERSGRISQSFYTPVSYAIEAGDKNDVKGIEGYVDVYPLAVALYDALVDKPDFERRLREIFDENGKVIGSLPYIVKAYSKINQITPSVLGNVIRNVLQKEHPELNLKKNSESLIQKADKFAASLINIFSHEYDTWVNQINIKIKSRQDAVTEQVRALKSNLNGDQEENGNRWEDFSVWWADEVEKEHVRREQWAEDQLQWIQQEYYQESVRQESAKIRGTMLDILSNEIMISGENWINKNVSLESKRAKKFVETQQQLDGFKTTHIRAVSEKLKHVSIVEAEQLRLWRSNPINLVKESIIYVFGTIAIIVEKVSRPFVRYYRETAGEIRKISWPTRQAAWQFTVLMLEIIVFWGTVTTLIDILMRYLLSVLLSH